MSLKGKKQFLRAAFSIGKYTDCVFLVGPDNENQQSFPCLKAILTIASPVLNELIEENWDSNNPQKPIRIKNMTPDTFNNVIKYIVGNEFPDPLTLEQTLQLGRAANILEIAALTPLCAEKVKALSTIDQFWTTLNTLMHLEQRDFAKASLHQMASENTMALLTHSDFKKASPDSVLLFLEIDTMDILNELQLVELCKAWEGNEEDDRRSNVREYIRNIRTLTFELKDLKDMRRYYTEEEMSSAIICHILKNSQSIEKTSHVCPIMQKRDLFRKPGRGNRRDEGVQKLIPDSWIIEGLEKYLLSSALLNQVIVNITPICYMEKHFYGQLLITNVLTMITNFDIYLTGFKMLCRAHGIPKIHFDGEKDLYLKSPLEKSYKTDLSINNTIYNRIVCYYGDSIYVTFKSPIRVKRNVTFKLEVDEKVYSGTPFMRKFFKLAVNDSLKDLMDRRIFKELKFSNDQENPIFISNIFYEV